MSKYLVTSALPYINGIKHLGNLIGSILPADVYTKYLKQHKHEVLFICGTDEHGTPAELAAMEANLEPNEYCELMYNKQKEIYTKFGINFTYFGRSSSKYNHKITQEIFLKLQQNNLIIEKEIKQIYSIDDNRFLPDRYIIGTCPYCYNDKARGDQCEKCSKLLDSSELIDPYSAISGSKNLEIKLSKHLFLDLPKLQNKLRVWVESHKEWSNITKSIALKWLDEGLTERCISRDLKWGVPIPGCEDKVFYVWFDAPIAYISLTQEFLGEDKFCQWWQQNDDTHYVQFMAKDNIPFHTIFFPAMIIGSRQNLKLVDNIKGFNWLTYQGGKFSTSLKRGVFLDQAIEIFPADYWRYYLLSNAPESSDADFTFENFALTINKDLADILGNFISRVFALTHKYFESKIPSLSIEQNTDIAAIKTFIAEQLSIITLNIEQTKFREAIKALRRIWTFANEYVTSNKPWEYVKTNLNKAGIIIANCFYIMELLTIAAFSFIPHISQEILLLINSKHNPENISAIDILDYTKYNTGRVIMPNKILIKKIDRSEVVALNLKFSGKINDE